MTTTAAVVLWAPPYKLIYNTANPNSSAETELSAFERAGMRSL
eukprot:CAMPEP_0118694458 /NCGR_PEP_ID=MMETSP0800-20121206/12534_1 /TAXON_ID=210618 ORGANISM="Striatella unipunctata, Strain CCMP2910" /NCGR_SAMPLE_ID=MMETSP0800 /ASSEMBLY_ACC=CAM_ASM_000638 /LENGTH=42 /DNA_ID= /DNA_START= /DNA_END= /DNA_ORIENTATION=